MHTVAKAIGMRAERFQASATEKPFEPDTTAFVFPTQPLWSTVLTVEQVAFAFGSRTLFEKVSFSLERGDKLALCGPNGSGKTTLMRILLGELEPCQGRVLIGGSTKVAYLSQGRTSVDLSLDVTELFRDFPSSEQTNARSLLGRLGIRGDSAKKKIGDLSVGERTKVELVRAVMSGANLLILDEPTNHLDIPSLEALERAMIDFPGAILFTSHDRALVESVATARCYLSNSYQAEPDKDAQTRAET